MKIRKKYRLIGLLMIVSMIALVSFSCYWLAGQYRQEREALHDKLVHEFMISEDQVLDSLILVRMVDPAGNDSVTLSIRIVGDRDEPRKRMHTGSLVKRIQAGRTSSGPDSVGNRATKATAYTVRNDSIPGSEKNRQDDLVRRSIELIYLHNRKVSNSDSAVSITFTDSGYRQLFRKVFSTNLEKKGLDFGLVWMTDTTIRLPEPGPHTMVIRNDNLSDDGAVGIEKIRPYLLRNIVPQFLFVFFLVGITGAAFLLTHGTMRKQVSLNAMRRDFISNMTHELKTPVATIKVALEALDVFDVKKDPGTARDYMEIATREIGRLEGLVAKVLDHAILEERQQAFRPEKIGMKALLEEITAVMKVRTENKDAVIELQCGETPCWVEGDLRYIQAVVINLLDNSLKYSGERPRITLILSEDDQWVCAEVRDRGPGIPPQYRDRIFERFFRIPTGDRHNVKGHGMGLSLAAQVMKMHHGRIIQKNLPGGGCSFMLQFNRLKHED